MEISRPGAHHKGVTAGEMLAPIRRWLRVHMRQLGYDVHRIGSIGRTMDLALAQLQAVGLTPNTVIDIGVAQGTPELYAAFPKARYILVEPLVEFEKDLIQICSQLRGEYFVAAAGAQSGSMLLQVNGSATSRVGSHRPDSGAEVRRVPVVTVDTIAACKAIDRPVLIKADVQGAELDALRGAEETLRATEAVVLEVSLFEFQRGWPQLWDVVDYMHGRAFVVYDICGGHCRPYDGALAQLDLVFVREGGMFRRYHGYQ
jgi:FkbM family methyltransferase